MKTIKQIADEIGVSKQAVQKRLSREPLYTSLQTHLSTDNGIKYIDKTGELLIKVAYNKIPSIDEGIDTPDNQQPNVHSNVDSDVLAILRENIAVLQKQLDVKDKQIEELTATIRIQAESINADRHNALAETIIDTKSIAAQSDEADGEGKKRGFWRFWKK